MRISGHFGRALGCVFASALAVACSQGKGGPGAGEADQAPDLGEFGAPLNMSVVNQTLPAGFQLDQVITGHALPVAFRFVDTPAGGPKSAFLSEKGGRLFYYGDLDSATSPVQVIDLSNVIHNYWDRGMLGLAIHPQYPAVPEVYVMYAYDANNGWNDDCLEANPPTASQPGGTNQGCVVNGRISRITINQATLVGAEQVLLQGTWCQQYPSHSVGDLSFGPDGYLYATAGDGASFGFADWGQKGIPLNPCDDPPAGTGTLMSDPAVAEGGMLRAQDILSTGDPVSLDGTLLRMDVSGPSLAAPASNPLVNNGVAGDDYIVAIGLRNPYRFSVRPGTNEIWIADVGWAGWEELNRVVDPVGAVDNFGWPCYEGPESVLAFNDNVLCKKLKGQSPLPPEIPAMVHGAPFFAYHHGAQVVPGEACGVGSSAITGIAFNDKNLYPSQYANAAFFADFSRKCVWVMLPGANGVPSPSNIQTFMSSAPAVDLQIGPDGRLYFVEHAEGAVYRVEYSSGNLSPSAAVTAAPTSGAAPLFVQFDATGSSDPDGAFANLAFAWDMDGDGQFDDATGASPSFTFTSAGVYTVTVRVTDAQGAFDTESIAINSGNSPPVATITSPGTDFHWSVGESIEFSGEGTDAQDGALPPSQLSWQILMHHCQNEAMDDCHVHTIKTVDGLASDTLAAADHEWPSFLELVLTVTDLGVSGVPGTALSSTASLVLVPETADVVVTSQPSGIPVQLSSFTRLTPYTQKLIVGHQATASVLSPVVVSGTAYQFQSWSDGQGQTHTYVVQPGDQSLHVAMAPIAVSCSNGLQDGDETGIDCGGSCPNACAVCASNELGATSAVATSVEGGYVPGNAIDDSMSSRWGSNFGGLSDAQADAQSITVDLGAPRWVNRVRLLWETASAESYTLQISNDGTTFAPLASFSGGGAAARTDDLTSFPAAAGRYVRMQGVNRATQWGYSLFDFAVYGDASPRCTGNVPTCSDGIQNGTEIGVDCGGSCPACPGCGNGVVEGAEQCDDGNAVNTDACTSSCSNAVCGDGYVRAGVEQCDDGNAVDDDGCSTSCVAATCSDGVENQGEAGVDCGGPCAACDPSACGANALPRVAASATSQEGGWSPAQAIDAVVKPSRWGSFYGAGDAADDNQSITIDLGQLAFVSRVALHWEAAAAEAYTLAISSDGSTFTTLTSFGGGTIGERVDDLSFAGQVGRYVRMQGVNRATQWGYSLFDVQVYGDLNEACGSGGSPAACGNGVPEGSEECDDGNAVEDDECTTSCEAAYCGDGVTWAGVEECDDGNLNDSDACNNACIAATCSDGAQNQGETGLDCGGPSCPACDTTACVSIALQRVAATATSQEGGWAPSLAIDAQIEPSRWGSNFGGLTEAQADAQSITVDLGATVFVDRVRLLWETASAAAYTVQISNDGVTFTTLASFTGGAAGGRADDLTFSGGAGRYVRMQGIDRATQWGYSLFDIAVFGDPNGACAP